MELRHVLDYLGLDEVEAKLYVAALEMGECLILPLSKHARLARTVIYRILPKLHTLGLISYGSKGQRQTIIAENPVSLLNLQEARIKEMRSTLPGLLANLSYRQPEAKIRSYDGLEGIKQVYEDTLSEEFPISSFLQVENINKEIQNYLLNSYVPRRVKRKIRVKNLVSGTLLEAQTIIPEEGSLRNNRYLDPKEFPAPMELLIYSNKVAFITYNKDQLPVAIVIENGDIAQTLRSLHKLGWEKAEAS